MLHTTDYKHFRVIYPNGDETVFEGACKAHRALPGDLLDRNFQVVKRAKHPVLIGVLELNSKIRFGMTAKNIPIYKFVPYNESYPPFFVGCSQKDLSVNMLARVEFLHWDSGTCPRGNLIEVIGACGDPQAEEKALLAHACSAKWLKGETDRLVAPSRSAKPDAKSEAKSNAITFHIDPPGCRDIDDAISIIPAPGGYEVKIHIADVGAWILLNPVLKKAATFGQTYYLDGVPVKPMFPPHLSENLFSLVPGQPRQTVTLSFFYNGVAYLDEASWSIEEITVRESYTYDTFYTSPHAAILGQICSSLAGHPVTDSHEWVEQLMLTYNTQAAAILKSLGTGLLRRHAGKDQERYFRMESLGLPAHKLAMRAGEYCASTEKDTTHCGLDRSAYCHASSPIRRWADCINQLALHDIIDKGLVVPVDIPSLNELAKRAKRFERDVLFMRAVLSQKDVLEAVVVEVDHKVKLWVPVWNRIVSSRHEVEQARPGDRVTINFFADLTQRSWKQRMVIRWALEN